MKLQYLVINNNKNGLYTFDEQYQIFENRDDAIKHFVEIGGDDKGMSLSVKAGLATIQKGGLIDLTFLPIKIQ